MSLSKRKVTELGSRRFKLGRYLFSESNPRDIINWLGYLGLIPFFVLSTGCWFFSSALRELAGDGFILYSLGILCFLAGTLWGTAQFLPESSRPWRLVVSNIFTVLAFVSVWLVNILEASFFLMISYFCIYQYEASKQHSRGWYIKLRAKLTFGVLISHFSFIGSLIS